MSNKIHDEILKSVPDFTSWKTALNWIQEGQQIGLQVSRDLNSKSEIISMDWSEIAQTSESSFGLYASENWRKFALATFFADLISYPNTIDQVNFDRLLFVMHAFPEGFRTWWIKVPNQTWWPVGYTGWYPMLESTFETFKKHPESLKDRMVVPNVHLREKSPFIYLFNFSVAPALKKSPLSNKLIKRFVQDIDAQKSRGLACITVSEEGVRIANRFGMTCSGYLHLNGSSEGVYTTT